MPHLILRFALIVLLALSGPLAAQTPATSDPSPVATGADTAPSEPQAAAQTPATIDYDAWGGDATRAENLIEAGGASTAFFENMRATLVDWRTRFAAAQSINAERIATLTAQLEALGPVPDAETDEPDAIAERRVALNEQLTRAQAPGLNATEALTRAEGLIREIDTLLRERQQQEFLELDPSPANPVNWGLALTSVRDVAVMLEVDLRERITNPVLRDAAIDAAPVITLLLLVGFLALLRGHRWTARLTTRLQRKSHMRGRAAVTFVVSLSQVAVPVLGVIAILAAVLASGLLGAPAVALLEAFGTLVIAAFTALWLTGRLFPEGAGPLGVLELDDTQKAGARHVLLTIGVLYGLGTVLETLAQFNEVSPAARGVLTLPVYVAMGFAFWRLSLLFKTGQAQGAAEDGSNFARITLGVVSKALVVIAAVGPLLALIGYTNAAVSVMLPTAQTLAILGVLVALQPVVRDLYALIFRTTQDAASDALLPIMVNFVLVFAAAPLVALTWGARIEELTEVYARFWQGATLGGVQITPGTVFAVVIIFGLGYAATRLLQGALKSTVLPRTRMDAGARNAVTSGVGYVGIALAALIAVTAGGIDLTALGFVLGALSVGIGFGLQNVVSNFVSGIILLIERPISQGDWIEVNGNMGIVKDISVRSTRIETFDKTDVIVPNADFISGTVTNWTRGNTIGRAVVTVGVAYGNDTRRVQQILLEIARENSNVATFPEPGVDFLGFGADSLDFRIRAILRDVNQLVAVKTELNHRIAERFAEEGIEIPFAQRDIWLRNPETLRDAVGGAASAPADKTEEGPAT
jgi:small-conductance mechanosensitive channel